MTSFSQYYCSIEKYYGALTASDASENYVMAVMLDILSSEFYGSDSPRGKHASDAKPGPTDCGKIISSPMRCVLFYSFGSDVANEDKRFDKRSQSISFRLQLLEYCSQ